MAALDFFEKPLCVQSKISRTPLATVSRPQNRILLSVPRKVVDKDPCI